MQDATIINGLVTRRSELAGELEHTQGRVKQLVTDLENLDATIRLFDADYRVEAIKPKGFRPPSDWANRGEMSRIILDVLRQAAEPLTSQDIAKELIATRGLDAGDTKLLRKMTKRCGVALRHQRDNGLVRSQQAEGMFMVWEVVR